MRLLGLLLLSASVPALAQAPTTPPPPAGEQQGPDDLDVVYDLEEFDGTDEFDGEEIIVTASRGLPGAVIGDIPPEVSLDARDVRAYGASNLGELLAELAPLTGSARGRGGGQPIVLLGGRRISSFREIRDIPPEAVVRVDILPEEVALAYGYRADQRVVNFVLRENFQAITAEVEMLQATGGGRQVYEADVNYLRLAEGSRLSLDGEYRRSNPLFETERNLIDADPDRTLLSGSDALKFAGTYNRTIFGNISATINAELEGENSLAALGRSRDGTQRLLRDGQTRNASVNYALNGDIDRWRWSATGGYVRNQSTTLTDRDFDSGLAQDRARSVSRTLETEGTANGNLFTLPAGAVSTTLKAGFTSRAISSESRRAGIDTALDLSREQLNGQVSMDFPILRDSPLGRLSVNANGTVDQLSDFGTLAGVGYGFNWQPFEAVRLIGSVSHEEGAPSIQQLGNPVLVTPNVRVLDVTTGQTVDITRIEGGNPDLLADSRRVFKLGINIRPLSDTNLFVRADYTDSRIDNPTASFPTATPEIEAAFPERFERDGNGQLLSIDSRPVNFARSRQRQLRWGFNWSESLPAPRPRGEDGRPLTDAEIAERRDARRQAGQGGGQRPGGGEGGQRGGWGGGGGPGGPGGFGRGGGGGGPGGGAGRLQLGLFHTWRLEDTILIRPGVPELDLLDGSATGGRGGQSRHELQLTAGYNQSGLGARLNVNWQSPTRVLADPTGGTASPRDLRFGAFTTANLRLFADLGQQRSLVRSAPFFRGSRVTLSIDNIFGQRLDVRDGTGVVPLGYQPDLLDPLGRTVSISFRKLFF